MTFDLLSSCGTTEEKFNAMTQYGYLRSCINDESGRPSFIDQIHSPETTAKAASQTQLQQHPSKSPPR
jgi:hypothetical protein